MKTLKAIWPLLVIAVALVGMSIAITGCSTYGHDGHNVDDVPEQDQPGVTPPDGTGPVLGGDCAPGVCCLAGSCQPYGCKDGFVCVNAACINVLQYIK